MYIYTRIWQHPPIMYHNYVTRDDTSRIMVHYGRALLYTYIYIYIVHSSGTFNQIRLVATV